MNEADNVRKDIAELAAPLKARLIDLRVTITAKQQELDELKQAAREAQRVLDILEPPEPKERKTRDRSGRQSVHPQTLANVQAWLLDHRELIDGNGGFSVPDLLKKHGLNIVSRATLTHAMNELHDIGFVRLDHKGTGGAKYWRLVT